VIQRLLSAACCLCAALLLLVSTASAQSSRAAQIDSPAPADRLSGMVTIAGSATDPAFVAYELSFSLDPDETETWFPIGERMTTSVRDDNLGIWDTTLVSDGNYQLRLQVFLEDGTVLEAIVDRLQVQNDTTPIPSIVVGTQPAPTSSTPTPPASVADPVPTGTPLPLEFQEEQAPPAPGSRVGRALGLGALAGGAALILTGLFLAARRDIRKRQEQRKMRNLLRRSEEQMKE